MTPIFLDTVGLLALWDVDDQWHHGAEDAYRQIVSSRQPVVTTTFILLECGNTAARRTYREDVCVLRRTLELRNEVIVPSEDDWANAWEAYQRGEAGKAGIVDHVSFAAMRRLGLSEAFTNDQHFRAAGSPRSFEAGLCTVDVFVTKKRLLTHFACPDELHSLPGRNAEGHDPFTRGPQELSRSLGQCSRVGLPAVRQSLF